jgi:hypothetical protein
MVNTRPQSADYDAWIVRARNVPIESEIERRGIKLNGKNERAGPCPKCGGDDRFSINVKKGVWNCRGCGVGGDVIDLVQWLDGVDFIPAATTLAGEPPKPNGKDPAAEAKKIVAARFDYCDEAGKLLFEVERIEFQNADSSFVLKDGKRKKTFRQRRPDPESPCWIWNIDGVAVVPYRLPELLEAIDNGHFVVIVEGEAKVDLLREWNLPATCCPMGAGKWQAEHAAFLRDADVVILPDNDTAGRDHADVIGASLQGVAASVRVLELPGLSPKGDVIDWAGQGGTVEQLHDLIAREAKPWHKPESATSQAENGAGQAGTNTALIQSSAQFVYGFVPPDYLIDGLLQRRFIYSLTGRTGGGKTALALLLAASVGTGKPIGDMTVEQGRVLYFAGENPDDVRMRWIAVAQQMDFDVNAIDVHFIPGVFKISELALRIAEQVETLGGMSLVVVDTAAAYFEGDDENSNAQQAAYGRRLRGLVTLAGGPCVIVLCHPVKNATDDNLVPRGGGAFVNEMDGNLSCKKDDSTVELHWQIKYRGPDFAPIAFMLRTVTHEQLKDSKDRLIPTVVASHLSEIAQEELASVARTNENKLLAALADNEGASLTELAKSVGWLMRTGAPHKMMVKRTLEKLKKAKLITVGRDGPTLTEAGRKTLK